MNYFIYFTSMHIMSKSHPIAKHFGYVSTIKMRTLMTLIRKITLSLCERYTHSGLFLHEVQSINVLFLFNREGYCNSIAIEVVLQQQYCNRLQEYLFLINALYFKKGTMWFKNQDTKTLQVQQDSRMFSVSFLPL